MSFKSTSRQFIRDKILELRNKSREIGIMRSVDATYASRDLDYCANLLTDALLFVEARDP